MFKDSFHQDTFGVLKYTLFVLLSIRRRVIIVSESNWLSTIEEFTCASCVSFPVTQSFYLAGFLNFDFSRVLHLGDGY